jgi:hypothetical protein
VFFACQDEELVVRTSLVGSCVSPVEARQGFLDRPIFIVPIVSCALVILFFGFMLGQLFAQRPRSRSTATTRIVDRVIWEHADPAREARQKFSE